MGDLLFFVYFDFETATGDSILHNPKMFVIRYCQIYAFYTYFKLDKIIIFRSFEETEEEIYSLDHISQAHPSYFDIVTFNQLSDAAPKVLGGEKFMNLNLPRILWLKG